MTRATILFVVAALIAITLLVLFRKGSANPSTATLPNGMRVELLGVSVGAASFTTERSWHKVARQLLPAGWQNWLPPAGGGGCSSGTNSIAVHFLVTDPSGARINQPPWNEYLAQDDHEFVYERTAGYCSSGGGSNSTMYSLILRAFPRRQPAFKFDFLGPQQIPIASFRVKNPVQGPFTEWTPAPLPQRKTNGPVTLTLESIKAGMAVNPRYIAPRWRIESTSNAWAKARARYFTVHDCTGNSGQILSTNEPAWRISTLVHREKESDFGPEDRFSLTNITIPVQDGFVSLDQSATRAGVTFKVHVLASPGELVISNGVRSFVAGNQSGGHSTSSSATATIETWSSPRHFFLIEVNGAASDDEIRFHLRDQSGAKIPTTERGTDHINGGGRIYRPMFTLPEQSTSLSMDVILSRPLSFDFVVDPRDLQPFIAP